MYHQQGVKDAIDSGYLLIKYKHPIGAECVIVIAENEYHAAKAIVERLDAGKVQARNISQFDGGGQVANTLALRVVDEEGNEFDLPFESLDDFDEEDSNDLPA